MAAAHGELQEEKAKNLSSSQSYQRVADRVQQWNRAIPEAGYVTLGTIRYGVRLSTGSHQLGGFSGSSTSSSQIIQTVQRNEGFSPNSTTTTSRSGSSDRSIESGNFNSCCCIGPSGIVLPWTNNYARTKLPVSSATAKNRTLSTSKSSSFSLRAMSAPDPPPAVRGPQPPPSEHLRPGESISSVIVLNPSQSTSTSKGDSKGVHHETHIEMSTLASTVPYLPRFTSSQAIAESAKSVSSVATITPSTMPAPTTEPTTASNTTLCQSCCSVSCAAVSCCKLNSASVLFDQCRELSVSPTPKSLPSSICCYTIANNSKAISKPSNRLNPKRIPRAVVQQTISSVRSCQTNQIPGAPPPVPPKPTNSESNEDHSVDPVNFRRKIQKFELQTAIDNEKNNRFEFFGCFSATPVNLDRSDCVSSTISEVSSNQGNDYQAILRSNKSHVSDTVYGSANQSDHRNGYPAKRTLRYNNAGKPVPQPIDPSTINIRSFGEPSTATVVIRKLTPKLSKKSFQFGDQHLRSESEDRLIDRGDSDQPTPTSVDSIANSDVNEDDSDIGFIDSSGDGDRLSSLSDLDVRTFSTKTVTPFNKNNSCNLSFDSVPKIINNCNEGYVRSLSARDLYNSLSDIESSTLSCLSEDSICCACNDSCQHIKSDQNIATSSDCCCLCCCSDRRGANCEIISGAKHYCCKCQKRGKRSLCESVKHLSPSPPPPPLPSHPPPSLNPLQQLSLGSVKGPVLKRVPAIESFGYISKSQQLTRGSPEKGCMMEKRRNTLDRLQRLGFGRKSSPSPTPENKSSGRKSSDKSERLKELTELLKGNRSSPTPPPIPPPRKLKHSNSVEKPPDPEPGPFTAADSDDIIPMDEEEEHIPEPVNRKSDEISLRSDGSVSAPPINTQKHSLYQFLKPNSSISNLESIGREKSKSPPLISPKDEELFSKLAKAESRTIVNPKTIPFRSASFSQIDYSSGKYIKSALGAIRDRLRRDKEPSVVESANLTLPRKKDSSKGFLKRSNSIEKDSRICPVKKTELSISLKFEPDNEKVSLEEIVNPPDVIFEEENYPADSEKCFDQQDRDIDEELDVPGEVPTMLDESIAEPIKVIDSKMPTSNTMPNLATLAEEDIPLESPPENFLQTATTCLIPVPVYECVAREWNAENPPEQWVDVAPNEIGINSEIAEPVQEGLSPTNKNDGGSSPEETTDMSNFAAEPQLPTISVSEDSIQTPDSLPFESDLEGAPTSPMHTLNRNIGSLSSEPSFEDKSTDDKSEEKPFEFIEVKKRYSNDEPKIGDRSLSLDQTVFRGSEEKRRIDKSRRRKGMYIQWPTIDRHVGIDSTDWSPNPESIGSENLGEKGSDLDLTKVDFSTIKSAEDHSPLYFTCRTPEDNRTPGSQYSFDPSTPESDCSRPNWPRVNRRTSLSCQSSEEKDESLTASPGQRPHRNLLYLRSDSISDNESDRTPPSLRDRTSPSPAPGDQDFKRYSKRPLRGPYGQMLEAEMKKPGKHHYDEILEELKDPKSLNTLSVHHRGQGNLSFDETQLSQQQSKLNRGRKSNNSLPVPAHTRAASTPSQMENTTTTASMGTISPSEKRYQSSMDMDSNSSKSKGKEPKKFSLDSNRDKSPKRASSEATPMDNIKQHPKRSASTASEKHQKRSLDEVRLSQVSRTPSERSMVSESGKGGGILPTPELLAELLKGSSERLISEQRQQMFMDTRTYVVQEIFRNEQSYVESLQTVVKKYLNVLKTPEYAGMIDSKTVDEIFFMVPDILSIHEKFLSELKARLDSWDPQQKVGDSFIETFSRTEVLETYTAFVNNCNRAKDAIKMTCQSRPSFARFLEAMSREHKGKLPLDNLLIKPVQKFPNYEMLFTRLIKHTDIDHPDQKPLQEVLKLVHDILVHINCKEKEVLENGQREATLRELEGVIEGITDLVAPQRQFLIFDLVSMPSGQGARKERGFFLFSDLLVITSIKRRSGTIRKPNTTTCPGSVASTLDTNKYKFLTKVSLDHLEIVKTKDENLRRIMNEIEQLADDCNKLQQIAEVTATLRYPHQTLEETIRDLHREVQRQLSERQSNDAQLNLLELTVSSPGGNQNLSIVFSKAEKRSQWEEAFNEAKQKLAASLERHPIPEFLMSIPIRKTRAGLQFTCAAPTLSNQKDVWVCNSDGYVGQVCVLSLIPDPTVTSCNGVCNARILCVASVPAYSETKKPNSSSSNDETPRNSRISNSSHCQIASNSNDKKKTSTKAESGSDIQLDSNSSSEESEVEGGTHPERMPSPAPSMTGHHQNQDSNSDETDNQQSTMWLGTEDGCIHVYNCTDNIRIKKNKIKIQHVSAVYSILYLDNRVFVALANGDICVYLRDSAGWNTASPLCISIGTVSSPVSRLLNVHGKLWCSIQGIIKVLDTKTLQVENQIQISSDSKPITNMAVSSNFVWISIQNSAHIKCFHSNSHELILEVNLAPSVNKMLSNCDDIIRQHKAACLRVTSLLACRDLIWIGTSAGVLLTLPAQGYTKGQTSNMPVVTGIPHGHTGHVRFLTCVDTGINSSSGTNDEKISENKTNRHSMHNKTKPENGNILIISGGDGYEDFRSSGVNTMSEVAGREDSTNHLLLWQM